MHSTTVFSMKVKGYKINLVGEGMREDQEQVIKSYLEQVNFLVKFSLPSKLKPPNSMRNQFFCSTKL